MRKYQNTGSHGSHLGSHAGAHSLCKCWHHWSSTATTPIRRDRGVKVTPPYTPHGRDLHESDIKVRLDVTRLEVPMADDAIIRGRRRGGSTRLIRLINAHQSDRRNSLFSRRRLEHYWTACVYGLRRDEASALRAGPGRSGPWRGGGRSLGVASRAGGAGSSGRQW